MSDTSSPVFPESKLLSISTHLEDGLIPPPAPPAPLFPSLAPYVPYVSSSDPNDYQQPLSPFQSALGLVPDPDGQRNAQTDAGERKEVSREDRDPSAREKTRRKTSKPLRVDAEFPPAKPYSPPVCVGCRKRKIRCEGRVTVDGSCHCCIMLGEKCELEGSKVKASRSQSRDQYSVLEAGSPTSSTSSSLHPSTSLSPPVVPDPSRKRKSDVDTPYIPFSEAQNPKTSNPVKPRKKKNDPEEQTSTSDATFQPSTSTRQITAPRVSQACRSCRSRKTRCSGIPEGGSCAQCEKGRFICALDARGSNDRAAASRRKRIAEDALAAGGSSTSPVASFSVPSHALPSLVPQPPSTKPSKPLQLNSPEPPRSSSPSLFPPKQHHFPPLFLPKIEPIRLAPLALLPPPPPPQSPSNGRVPIGNGNFWIFYSDTPGVLQIEDLPDGSTKTMGGRRQGLMMLARFEETGSYGAHDELSWIIGSLDATRSILSLKKEVICVSSHSHSIPPPTTILPPLANFTYDLTASDSTFVTISFSLPPSSSSQPQPFLQAIFTSSPLPSNTSPVVAELRSNSTFSVAKAKFGRDGRLETVESKEVVRSFWIVGLRVGAEEEEGDEMRRLGGWIQGGDVFA